MHIQIGTAPDYVMRRGQEILNHRMNVVITCDNHRTFDETFSNRSLAMILRSARSVLERQNISLEESLIHHEIHESPPSSKVLFSRLDRKIEIVLYLPPELRERQIVDFIYQHRAHFEKPKS